MFSGGSSVGNRDLIVDVIARGEMVFHGIAVKPENRRHSQSCGPFSGCPKSTHLSNAYVLFVRFFARSARLPAPERVVRVPPDGASRRRQTATSSHRAARRWRGLPAFEDRATSRASPTGGIGPSRSGVVEEERSWSDALLTAVFTVFRSFSRIPAREHRRCGDRNPPPCAGRRRGTPCGTGNRRSLPRGAGTR